jgi:UDP-N-acetylmuramoyl-tripeptide--D-alanyl-D-alanine ligase
MKEMLRGLASLYSWRYPTTLVYMLQSTEYQVMPYLRWYWHTQNFARVAKRRTLDPTLPARMLLLALWLGIALELAAALAFGWWWHAHGLTGGLAFGIALLFAYPVVWAHVIALPLVLGRLFIMKPREQMLVRASEHIFREHPGIKIAIAGSYGKTSMKELLSTVLSQGKTVAATPANKNVSISHAYFARKLTGEEDVLLIEYGEGAPGDVARFATTTHPTHAVITGLAPAHLDQYGSVAAAGRDIFSVAEYVKSGEVYVNQESLLTKPFIKRHFELYSAKGALGWKVGDVHVGLDGTRFTLKRRGKTMHVRSGLVGRHHVGPLALAATLAYELGLTIEQIEVGVSKTQPFEHRMQPYALDGAWIIDDTYNGNIEGIRVGTALLRELPGTRKIYVTPGLVDQGDETVPVHEEMGKLIAGAKPDIVVLMQNSAAPHIQAGLRAAKFKGELLVEPDPLSFYTNLSLFVAAGDVVLMQNDWPDHYA